MVDYRSRRKAERKGPGAATTVLTHFISKTAPTVEHKEEEGAESACKSTRERERERNRERKKRAREREREETLCERERESTPILFYSFFPLLAKTVVQTRRYI